jgi:hypothetical protein
MHMIRYATAQDSLILRRGMSRPMIRIQERSDQLMSRVSKTMSHRETSGDIEISCRTRRRLQHLETERCSTLCRACICTPSPRCDPCVTRIPCESAVGNSFLGNKSTSHIRNRELILINNIPVKLMWRFGTGQASFVLLAGDDAQILRFYSVSRPTTQHYD